MNICLDPQGKLYEIPNYCINEPAVYDSKLNYLIKPEKKILNVYYSL